MFGLSVGDSLIKGASAEVTLWQVFTLRSAITVPLLILIVKWRDRQAPLMPVRPGWVTLRSLLLSLQWIAYYIALPHIDLGIAASTYYSAPLFILLFAGLFAGERIGPKGWIAVGAGFAGVVVLLNPDAEAFNAYALLPVVSAVCYAGAMVMTRTHGQEENPLVLGLGLNAAMLVVGASASAGIWLVEPSGPAAEAYRYVLGPWGPVTRDAWGVMAILAVAMIMGSVGAAVAYRAAPASTVAPFDFFYVLFATTWGLAFFGETLGPGTLAGMALIVGAGVLATRR